MVVDTGPGMLFPALNWAYAAAAKTDPGVDGRWKLGSGPYFVMEYGPCDVVTRGGR